MPTKLDLPICAVNTTKIRHLSTSAENLHGLWSVFSKCSEFLEDGERLENMSWRIWNRETFCCDSLPEATHPTSTQTQTLPRPKKADIPALSASVDSLASDTSDNSDRQEEADPETKSKPVTIQHSSTRKHPSLLATSRGRETHITPLRLERMVGSIQVKQQIEPLSPTINDAVPSISPPKAVLPSKDITPRPNSPTAHISLRSSDSSSTAPFSSPESDRSTTQTVGSDTSAEMMNSHNIIRGFSPNRAPSSYRSHTHLAPTPVPAKSISHPKVEEPKKAMFMLGGSSGDDESSFEDRIPSHSKQSSLSSALKRAAGAKKTTSFRDEIQSRLVNNKSHEDEEVFVSEDEDSSAIDDESEDDDDEEDWEDDGSDGAEANANEKPLFQRVDSTANLASRRSLLTSLMNEGDRQAAFANMAQSQPMLRKSKTQVRMDPSIKITEPENEVAAQMKRSKPMMVNLSNAQPMPVAFSPKTTRRYMLASEMTESLRKQILFERQQKKATASAVLKRRHTTQDLTKIKAHPSTEAEERAKENFSWNDEFGLGGIADYHQSGW